MPIEKEWATSAAGALVDSHSVRAGAGIAGSETEGSEASPARAELLAVECRPVI